MLVLNKNPDTLTGKMSGLYFKVVIYLKYTVASLNSNKTVNGYDISIFYHENDSVGQAFAEFDSEKSTFIVFNPNDGTDNKFYSLRDVERYLFSNGADFILG